MSMSQSFADSPHVPLIETDFARLGAWRKDAIALGSTEMLEQRIGREPVEGERVLLREPHNLEAFAHLKLGELGGHVVWFGEIEPETLIELDADEALAQFWATHPGEE
jgi:hypothetical protein